MPSDSSTIPMWHKCTISEHVTEKNDPFAVRKKAREAAKQVPVAPGANKPSRGHPSMAKKVPQVWLPLKN